MGIVKWGDNMQTKDDCDDELLHKAIDLLLDRDTVSEFILQRNLWIGYGKAKKSQKDINMLTKLW